MNHWKMLILALFLSLTAVAQADLNTEWGGRRENRNRTPVVGRASTGVTSDAALVNAVNNRRNVDFLEAKDMVVTKLLKDDTQGLPHQKFVVQLSSGATVLCVFNLDMGQRVPLREGDRVGLGGQFKWTESGALMHWLHEDPKHHRPDGYVELAGKRYGLN